MSDDRTIALRNQTPPDVAEFAGLIKAMLPNGKNLTDQEAIAGAMYGKAHNLDPFKQEYYIVPGRGIFPGYRGEMRANEQREYYTQTRPLNGDEAAEHEILAGDTARIVELYQPDLMRQMRTLGITYQPIAGLGIVRKAEKQGAPPTGRSWAWKAEQRALKDAMRHMQGGADILNETAQDRLDAAEQDADAVLAEVRNLEPDERQAQFAGRVDAMRGDPERNPFDDPAPQRSDPPADTVDGDFERIPSATQERAAQSQASKLAVNHAPLQYGRMAAAFAAEFPAYQNKNGIFDDGHIRASLASRGYEELTPENIEAAFGKLAEHALSKLADAEAAKRR